MRNISHSANTHLNYKSRWKARDAVSSQRHGKAQITAHLMLQEIGDIRHDQPELAEYLNHPEIVTGLAVGRFGRKGLVRRLTEMADADSVAA